MSEFGGANYPNSVFSFVTAKLSTTVVGEYVDGEAGARIYWYINDGTTDDYTAGLKLVSDNSIVISAVNPTNGNNTNAYVTLGTIPNIAEATDKYYPFVTTGTYTNAVSSSMDHFDQLAGGVTGRSYSSANVDASDESVSNVTITPSVSTGIQTGYSVSPSSIIGGDGETMTATDTGEGNIFSISKIEFGNV